MTRMLLVAFVATLSVASSGSAQTKTPASGVSPALERSKALVAAPAGDAFAADASIPAVTARAIADELARDVPLPAGGTFSGIRWEEAGGVFSRAEIVGVLEYNAACQWLRAWRDGREKDTAQQVLADVPAWPAWRFAETAGVLGRAVAEVRTGGGEAAAGLLAECDAAHAREGAYASARGLAVSR
jgi:hypothetical protein